MSIEIQCPSCKKRFRVDDRFAGRRVKCRNCAAAIAVPAADDVDDLAELEASPLAAGIDEDLHEPAGGDVEAPEELPQGFGAALLAARSRVVNRRFALAAYPGAALAHQYLPWIIGVICVGLSIWLAVQRVLQTPPPHTMLATIVGLSLVLFFAAVVPVTTRGLASAARMLHFDLPQGAGWRVLGLFSLPLLLAMMLSDSLGGVIAGLAVGILMLMPLIWATFQLHWVEAVVAWMMTSLFFAGSAAASGGFVFLVGLGIALSLNASQPPPDTGKIAVKSPVTKPVDVVVAVPPTPPPATQMAVGPATQPGDLVVAPPPPDLPPVLPPPLPPPTTLPTLPGNVFSETPPAPRPVLPSIPGPAVPPPPPVAKTDHVVIAASPVVAGAKELTWVGEFEQVQDADGLQAPMSVLKRTALSETIEVLHHDEQKPAASVSFKRDPGGSDRYVLSPSGDALARIVTWPKPAIQLWTTADGKVGRSTELDWPNASATPVCFTSANEVLVHRMLNDAHAIQLYNVRTGVKRYEQRIAPLTENGYAISPDGRTLAIATRIDGAPFVQLVEISSGRTRKLAIPLAPQWPLTPAGMAFSLDSTRIGIVFEQEGNVLAVAWNANSTVKQQEHVYPAGTLAVPQHGQFKGRALDWLADGTTWLLYGNLLVDVPSGQTLGTLGISTSIGQRVVDGKQIYVQALADTGGQRLVQVDLNPDAFAKGRPASTTRPAPMPMPLPPLTGSP